jgi:Na+/H+-dicarboxylate symporter
VHRFYYVTFSLMALGLLILCLYAPWTQPVPDSPNVHQTIGYAPVWSTAFAQIPAAHVDWSGAFAAYAAAIVFFSIVLGAIAYFFREKRGKPVTHRMKPRDETH